jgi:hypothetical protein
MVPQILISALKLVRAALSRVLGMESSCFLEEDLLQRASLLLVLKKKKKKKEKVGCRALGRP